MQSRWAFRATAAPPPLLTPRQTPYALIRRSAATFLAEMPTVTVAAQRKRNTQPLATRARRRSSGSFLCVCWLFIFKVFLNLLFWLFQNLYNGRLCAGSFDQLLCKGESCRL